MEFKQILLILLSLLLIGCANSVTEKEKTYQDLMNDAWKKFEQQDYDGALATFLEAETMDKTSDVVGAIGWTYLLKSDLENATKTFSQTGFTSVDITAGLGFLFNAIESYGKSIEAIKVVENQNPNWSFGFGLNLGMNDLYILLAQNQFLLGNYNEALVALKKVDKTFVADPNTLEGRKAMSQKIESLNKYIIPK